MWIAGSTILAVALMAWLQVRDVRRVKRIRRDAVVSAQGALTDVEVVQDGIAYPTLHGRFGDHPAKVELIVDTVTLRQLPRLWLAVTVKCPTSVRVPVDCVLRPLPTDIVSPGMGFAYEHPVPPDWSPHMRIATPQPGPLPPLRELAALGSVLGQQETKSVLVTARGVRIVTELARGDVALHRVTRRPDFRFLLGESRLRHVLADAVAIAGDVTDAHAAA